MQIEIPGYRIIRTLGKGGMASVYLAIQESFEREVALKIMSPELSKDDNFGERFLREARIVSRLVHPHIVTVYDVGIHDGYYFLSMEYVPGQDLTRKRFDLDLVGSLQVVKDIARALDFAGKKGYVHRDVKPENIMLHEESGRAVLMDFGIARPSDIGSGMTQTGMAIGTPHYMSPEQAKGMTVDARADLYSLGVVLFLLLTGRVPYHADSAVVVGIMHVSEDIPRLPPYVKIFQSIIDRVLAKDPADRYQTGAELISDLEAISPQEITEVTETRELALAMVRAEEVDALQDADISPAILTPEGYFTPVATGELEATVLAPRHPTPGSPLRAVTGSSDAQSNSQTPPRRENRLVVSAEDRVGRYDYGAEKKSGSGGLLWLMLGVAALAGGGFYFQEELKHWSSDYFLADAPMNTQETLAAEPLPDSTQLSPSEQSTAGQLEVTPGTTPAADLTQTPSSAEVTNSSQPNIGPRPEWIEQANPLRNALREDLSKAPELVAIYRAALNSESPLEQQMAQAELANLQAFYVAEIQTAIEQQNTERVLAYSESAKAIFEENEWSTDLQNLFAASAKVDADAVLLAQAESYIAANALSSPAGANALEVYRALLQDNPNNQAALDGIQTLAQRYGELAAAQQKKGNIDQALDLNKQGLALHEDDAELQQQQQVLTQLQQEQQKRRAAEKVLLDKAKSQQELGQFIAPRGDNALETYRELLAQNPRLAAAREGESAIEKALALQVRQLIQAEDFSAAQTLLASARESFPQSQSLLTLSLDLDQAITDNMPSVTRLAVTSQEASALMPQEASIVADRIIYIGFEYRNFKTQTSVVQAVLYDGSRSHQIVQVPVIISGSEGTQFFRMEQPVTGFAEGGYSIDILLENQPLITARFSVKKSL